MAQYQNSTVSSNKLIIGNYKIEYASVGTTAGATWENLGAGIINSFGHNIVKYDVQAGNAPDPIEGIASETFTVSGELIEYDGELISSAMGGILTVGSTATDASVIYAGGKTAITEKAFKLTNTRLVSGVSEVTSIIVYKATFNNGPQFTAKSDNDADPISVMSFELTGKVDTTASVGAQLYEIRKWID